MTEYSQEDFEEYEIDGPIHASSFLNSLVIPRPIAFITSLGSNMVNAAPFSYFNIVCTNPAMISVAIERRQGKQKDTARNIECNQEFVVNLCSIDLVQAITVASQDYPPDCSEIQCANLKLIPSSLVKTPRIANTQVQLECTLYRHLLIGDDPTDFILGKIVKVHIRKEILNSQKKIDVVKLNPLGRIAGSSYTKLGECFRVSNEK